MAMLHHVLASNASCDPLKCYAASGHRLSMMCCLVTSLCMAPCWFIACGMSSAIVSTTEIVHLECSCESVNA
jgi:hypothetical protein